MIHYYAKQWLNAFVVFQKPSCDMCCLSLIIQIQDQLSFVAFET